MGLKDQSIFLPFKFFFGKVPAKVHFEKNLGFHLLRYNILLTH